MLAHLVLTANREAFVVPFTSIVVYWYGILFALGFLVGFLTLVYLYKRILILRPSFYLHEINFNEFTENGSNLQKQIPLQGIDFNGILKGEWTLKLKEQVLDLLNQYIYSAQLQPTALAQKDLRLLQNLSQNRPAIQNRIILERAFPTVFISIHARAKIFVERLSLYVILGTVIGARLGHILFYEDIWHYLSHPFMIINTREGGLASHGGALGIFAALYFFIRRYRREGEALSWRFVLDMIMIPTALAAVFIRTGNFINQEIIGTLSNLPWAVVFPYNFEGVSIMPRHPVQIYEALAYLMTFIILYFYSKSFLIRLKLGEISGIFLVLVFGFRFILEFFKESQLSGPSAVENFLSMGQWLSLPMVIFGTVLLWVSYKNKKPLIDKGQVAAFD
ncbi:MAG: prolipoprotein diacylglyceryl transferase [Simkaniaceae bacterium]|nr:prolipoprotein diacylglyceryl transferase [Simkaniaceae bacterium]